MTDEEKFYVAVCFSDLETVRELHDRVDLNAYSEKGSTPLTNSIGGGTDAELINKVGTPPEMTRLLIELGADPNKMDRNGWTPWTMCLSRIDDRVVQEEQEAIKSILEEYGADRGGEESLKLWRLAEEGDYDEVKALLDSGVDPNPEIVSPLATAVASGHHEVVELLLERGADIEKSEGGMTPLMHAASDGDLEMVELLVKHGADVMYSLGGGDEWEFTAEGQAREAGHQEVADWLRERMPPEAVAAREARLAARNPKFKALYEERTSAPNYNLNTDDIVARLEQWDRRFLIKKVKRVGSSALTVVFEKKPEPLMEFAEEAYAFCPDIVDQGTETVAQLAKEIAKRNELFLWWD